MLQYQNTWEEPASFFLEKVFEMDKETLEIGNCN